MSKSNRQAEWDTKLGEVKAFSSDKKRWPSTTSKDEVEKELGQWWSRQKYLLNKKIAGEKAPGITTEREAQLKDLIAGNESFERDGIWDYRYKMVVDKFKADSKLWPYATKDEEQLKSIRWWNQQKTFARKFKTDSSKAHGGMTQDRYDKVVALARVMGQSIEEEPVATPTPDKAN